MAPVSITSDTFSLSEIKSRDFLKTKILLTLLQLHQVPRKKGSFFSCQWPLNFKI